MTLDDESWTKIVTPIPKSTASPYRKLSLTLRTRGFYLKIKPETETRRTSRKPEMVVFVDPLRFVHGQAV